MVNLGKGVNGILVRYLRERGGSAVVDATELSQQHGFYHGSVSNAAHYLSEKGILTIADAGSGLRRPKRMTLNEEVIAQLEATGKTPSTGTTPETTRKNNASTSPLEAKFRKVEANLNLVRGHQFAAENLAFTEPLVAAVDSLLCDCRALAGEVRELNDGNMKLAQAAFGLDATEADVVAAETVALAEMADAMMANEEHRIPDIPSVEFGKMLLTEPSKIFKPLARLLHGAKTLRGLAVELHRKTVETKLVREKFQKLISELNCATVDVSACLADWQRHGDRVLGPTLVAATVVVSTKQ